MRLRDMKIRSKIMAAVLLAGLVGVGVSVFGSSQLNKVDEKRFDTWSPWHRSAAPASGRMDAS